MLSIVNTLKSAAAIGGIALALSLNVTPANAMNAEEFKAACDKASKSGRIQCTSNKDGTSGTVMDSDGTVHDVRCSKHNCVSSESRHRSAPSGPKALSTLLGLNAPSPGVSQTSPSTRAPAKFDMPKTVGEGGPKRIDVPKSAEVPKGSISGNTTKDIKVNTIR